MIDWTTTYTEWTIQSSRLVFVAFLFFVTLSSNTWIIIITIIIIDNCFIQALALVVLRFERGRVKQEGRHLEHSLIRKREKENEREKGKRKGKRRKGEGQKPETK